MTRERTRFEHLYPLLQRSWSGLGGLASAGVLGALRHVGLGRSLHDTAGEYFDDETLKLAFSFQSAYLGMSPWDCPGGFSMVPYVEHAYGLYYLEGGVGALCSTMARAARELGATIRTECSVRRLVVEGDLCVGVELVDGSRLDADLVIINADATHAVLELLDRDVSLRFTREHVAHMQESCSTFMCYLGLDTRPPLGHHTFFFSDDYRSEMLRIFRQGKLEDDVSVYACNPVESDGTMAPPGHSALYLLALVPNTSAPLDWTVETPKMRERVLERVRQRSGFDIRSHIRAEMTLNPEQWRRQFGVSHGSVFGPAHSIDQLLAFRLPNQLPHPHNVFLAGGGTSPGSGLPTILESGRIAARLACEAQGIDFPASKPLPSPALRRLDGRDASTEDPRSVG